MKAILLGMYLIVLPVFADERIDQIEDAWNNNDTLAVQNSFSRGQPRIMAEIGLKAEQGGILAVFRSVRVKPLVLAAAVEINGHPETWLLVECQDDPKEFCDFGSRPNNLIGHAEKGQGLDIATTLAATTFSYATEANPLGLAVIPVKLGLTYGTRYMGFDDCVNWRAGLDMFGYSPAISNLLTLVGVPAIVSIVAALLVSNERKKYAVDSAVYECLQFAAWQSEAYPAQAEAQPALDSAATRERNIAIVSEVQEHQNPASFPSYQ